MNYSLLKKKYNDNKQAILSPFKKPKSRNSFHCFRFQGVLHYVSALVNSYNYTSKIPNMLKNNFVDAETIFQNTKQNTLLGTLNI